jgi:TPR repeat protein
MRKYWPFGLLLSLVWMQGCVAQPAANISNRIIDALQGHQYADAITLARQGQASIPEIDFAIGEIILQGWAADSPAQRPQETLEDGLSLLEKSALAGHLQAQSGLAALFFTGLAQGEKRLVSKNTALHTCWKAVQRQQQSGSACVALRKVPEPQ